MVSERLGDQTNELSKMLGVDLPLIRVYWKDLKYHLSELEYHDLVKDIEKNAIITKGDQHFNATCNNYQASIYGDYAKQTKREPIALKARPSKITFDRKEIFVELVTRSWEETYDNNFEHFRQQYHETSHSIKREEIIQPKDECVLVRGIAGIGKTCLLQSLLMGWSDKNEEVLNEFHLVLKIDCRELNVMKDIKCSKDILQRKYPDLFTNDLSHHTGNKKILILIDGIDEYKYLDDLKKILNHECFDNSPANALYELINPDEKCFVSNKVVLLCGRPRSCEEVKICLDNIFVEVKCVEVNGFNDRGVQEMMEKFPFNEYLDRESLEDVLLKDKNLYGLMHIPSYAYAICTIYNHSDNDDNGLIKQLNTNTKLNLALLLVHIREHMLSEYCSFVDMIKRKNIIMIIKEIAKYAYVSLNEKRIVFEEEEISQNVHLIGIEKSGIIVKYDNGEAGCLYQFSHLTLQELFAAIHIFCNQIDVNTTSSQGIFDNALQMYFGLLGLFENKDVPKYLALFVHNLNTERDLNIDAIEAELIGVIISKGRDIVIKTLYEYYKEASLKVKTAIKNEILDFEINSSIHEFNRMCHLIESYGANRVDLLPNACYDYELLAKVLHKCIKSNNVKPVRLLFLFDSMNDFNNLNDANMEDIASVLPLIPEVQIASDELTKVGFDELKRNVIQALLENQLELMELELAGCSLNDENVIAVADVLDVIDKTRISLNTALTEKGWNDFAESILQADHLEFKHLYIEECGLNDEKINVIALIFPMMEEVEISCEPHITESGWENITQEILQAHDKLHLKKLRIVNHCLDDEKMNVVAMVLPMIEGFDLTNNREITESGWTNLTRMIFQAHRDDRLQLRKLSLKNCNLNDEKIKAVAMVLPIIEKISLCKNTNITANGWKNIVENIQQAHRNDQLHLKELRMLKCLDDEKIKVVTILVPLIEKIIC